MAIFKKEIQYMFQSIIFLVSMLIFFFGGVVSTTFHLAVVSCFYVLLTSCFFCGLILKCSDYDRNVFQISNSLNVLIKFIKDTHALKDEISGYGAPGISRNIMAGQPTLLRNRGLIAGLIKFIMKTNRFS